MLWFTAFSTEAQTVSILPNTVQTICVGGTVNFTANLNGINPATVQGFSWTFQGGTPAVSNLQNPSVVYNTPQANPYDVQLTVTFNNGTGAQTVNAQLVQVFSVQSPIAVTPVTCHGGNNGTATLNITGSGNYNIVWNPTGPLNQSTANNLIAGNYTVQVLDLNANCPALVIPFTITEPSAISLNNVLVNDVTCFGANNGSITMGSVTGGTGGAYTFNWSDIGLSTQNRTNLPPNTYTVTVTDGANCTINQTFSVGTPFQLTAFVIPQDIDTVTCFGQSDGGAIVSVTGGTGTRSFAWSNPAGVGNTITNVPAGNYTVTVTDENNCVATTVVTIPEPNAIQVQVLALSHVTCNGFNDGFINIDVTGGNIPYTYAWSGPGLVENTEDIDSLRPGTYNLVITDRRGCIRNFSITITEPPALTINLDNAQQISCNGLTNGNIFVTVAGGNIPYTYNWSRNNTPNFSTNEDLVNVPPGNYLLNVFDNRGCNQTLAVTLDEPTSLQFIDVQVGNPTCTNVNDGSLRVDVEGGTRPYLYLWNNGSGAEEIVDLSAAFSSNQNPYSVTVTDARGCTIDTTITLVAPNPIAIALVSITPASCTGASTGAINVTVSGGALPYQYIWTGQPGVNNEDISNVACGQYTLRVIDNNRCETSQTFDIPCATVLTVTDVATNVTCNGGNTGSITLTVAGGNPFAGSSPYQFNWTRDGNFFGATQNLRNLVAGTYCFTVTDANSCTIERCIVITEPTLLSASISDSSNITCFGAANGTATVSVSGGAPPYTFSWNNGRTTPQITGLNPGTYSVVVTDANNCRTSNPISVTITQPTRVTVTLGSRTNVSCQNGNSGSITVNASGGTPFIRNQFPVYNYLWSDNASINSETRTNLTAGTYTVTVSDSLSCTASINVTITQPSSGVSATIASSLNVNCFGGTNGTIDLRPTGGTPPYTFAWSNNQSTEDLTNLPAGQYCVTVTDQGGCSTTACRVITQPTALTATIFSFQNESCAGQRDGRIVLNITGGTPAYLSIWSNGSRTRDLFNVSAGVYSVTVFDSRGCQTTATQVITAPTALTVVVDSSRNVACNGGNNGAIFVSTSGGSGAYTYIWSPGNAFTEDLTGLTAGTYTLTTTDGAGCRTVITHTVTQPLPLTITSQFIVPPLCHEESSGRIGTTVTGGTQPYTYSWSNDPFNNNTNANNLSDGTYTINVTDANGCTAHATFTITNPPALTATVTVQSENCSGDGQATLTANPIGGTPPYRFVWSTQETTPSITGVASGTYHVTVFDSLDCSVQVNNVTLQNAQALDVVVVINTATCNNATNGTIQINVLGGVEPYTYLWDNGSTIDDITNLTSGTYCLTVTDANGCTLDTCIFLAPPTPISITADLINLPSCSGLNNGAIDISVAGGSPPYFYLWSNSVSTEDVSNLAPGTYCVTVIDNNLCADSVCFVLTREPNPTVTFSFSQTTFCANDSIVVLRATPPGGIFTGNGVFNDSLFNPKLAGTSNVIITYSGNQFGCDFIGSTLIRVNPMPDSVPLYIGNSATVNEFCGDNTAPFNLVFSPVQSGTKIVFSGPGVRQIGQNAYQFVPSIAGIGKHTITGTITFTKTGCFRTISREITVREPILVNLVADRTTICRGETTILTATGATTYDWSPSTGLSCAPNCKNFLGTVVAAPTTTTTYTVIGKSGSCVNTQTVKIEVIQTPSILVSASSTTVCEGQPVQLRAVSAGLYNYIWSPRGTFAGGTGSTVIVNPIVTDTFFVTGQLPNGCFRTASIVVRVTPSRVLAEADQAIICLGNSTIIRAVSTEPGNFNFTWSPPTGLNTTRGGTVTATPKKTTTYTVTRSGSGNCRTTTVTVEVVDTAAKFTNTFASSYCNLGATSVPVILTADPPGGTFSGPGVIGNQFSPSVGAGTYSICYSGFINGCPFSTCQKVKVSNPRVAKILNFQSEYCYIKSPVQLIVDIPGVIITGNGMQANNVFNPFVAGIGTHILDLQIPPGTVGCYADTSYLVTVSQPDVQILGLQPVYCGNVAPITLTGVPSGGKFIGKGIRNGNIFDPSLAGIGTHTITYYGRDILCTYSRTQTVRVYPALTATATATPVTNPFTPNGTITINVSGGMGTYVYFFNGEAIPRPTNVITDLNAGTYSVLVFDVNTNCSVLLQVTVPSNVTVCNPPTNLASSNITDNTANISWSPVSEALSYEVEYNLTSDPANFITLPTINPNVSLAGLLCGTSYDVTVRAICGTDVISPNAQTLTFTTTNIGCPPQTCPAPADIVVSEVTTTSFRLTWIGVPQARAYRVQYKRVTDADPGQSVTVNAPDTTYVLMGLDPNTRYTYLINSICPSGLTSELIGDTTQTLSPCTTPANIKVTNITTNSATVSWDAQQIANRYVVSWRETGGSVPFRNDTVTQNSITLSGLTPGFEYEFNVTALCGSLGNSVSSATDTFTTNIPPPCRVPKDLRILSITTTSALLVWGPVDGATGFEIEYQEKGQTTQPLPLHSNLNAIVLTGLKPNTEYIWRVRAECGSGNFSDFSIDTTFRTLSQTITCSAPTGIQVSQITQTSATITWNPVPGAIRYELIYKITGFQGAETLSVILNSASLSNLLSARTYEFTIRTVCSANLSSTPVNGPNFTTLGNPSCPNPTNIRVDQITNRSAVVSWEGSPQASLYEVEYGPVGGLSAIFVTTGNTTITLNDLIPNTLYEVKITAKCGTNLSSATVNGPDFRTSNSTNCPTPTNLTITSVGATSISLVWNGSPLASSYQIDYRAQGQNIPQQVTSQSTSVTITNLQPGVGYIIVVRAVCGSNQVSTDTPPVTATTNDGSTCVTPINITVIHTTSSSADITWNPVANASSYRVSYKPKGSPNNFIVSPTNTPSITLANLLGNVEYVFFVETVCITGEVSLPSPEQNFKTVPSGDCPAPQNATFHNITDRSVLITWSLVPQAIRYEVNFRINGTLVFSILPADRNLFILDGLLPNTNYEVLLRTICSFGVSPDDNFVIQRFTTRSSMSCEPPTNLTVSNLAPTSVTLNWSPVQEASSYQVAFRVKGTLALSTVSTNTNSLNLVALVPNTTYEWVVRSLCSNNQTSTDVIGNDFTTPAGVSCGSTSFSSIVPSTNSIALTWTTVQGAVGYDIRFQLLPNGTVTTLRINNGNTTNFTLTGLQSNNNYGLEVRAICSGSNGAFSPAVVATTTPQSVTCQTPTNVRVIPGKNIALIQWTGAIQNATGYSIQFRRVGQNTLTTVNVNNPNLSSFTITNLLADTEYEVRMLTRCGTVNSVFSTFVRFRTLAGKEEGLNVSEVKGFEALVYPNPNKGTFTITMTLAQAEKLRYSVYDLAGKLIFNSEVNIEAGVNEIPFDLNDYAKGMYVIHLRTGSQSATARVLVD